MRKVEFHHSSVQSAASGRLNLKSNCFGGRFGQAAVIGWATVTPPPSSCVFVTLYGVSHPGGIHPCWLTAFLTVVIKFISTAITWQNQTFKVIDFISWFSKIQDAFDKLRHIVFDHSLDKLLVGIKNKVLFLFYSTISFGHTVTAMWESWALSHFTPFHTLLTAFQTVFYYHWTNVPLLTHCCNFHIRRLTNLLHTQQPHSIIGLQINVWTLFSPLWRWLWSIIDNIRNLCRNRPNLRLRFLQIGKKKKKNHWQYYAVRILIKKSDDYVFSS